MRLISAIIAILFVLVIVACYIVFPVVVLTNDIGVAFFSITVGCTMFSFLFGLLWAKELLSYWTGFAVGTVLGCGELAAAVLGVMELTKWGEHTNFENLCVVMASIIPFIVVNAFISVSIGGVVMGLGPALDWFSDLFRTKKDFRGKYKTFLNFLDFLLFAIYF
jgi:hypothetical protein